MAGKTKTKTVSDLTVEDLAQLIRQIVRDELKMACTVDGKGCLVFRDEESYARHVALFGKKPSKVKAYWRDEHGLKVRYSDDEVTPELARELDQAKSEPSVPADEVFADLRQLGVRV